MPRILTQSADYTQQLIVSKFPPINPQHDAWFPGDGDDLLEMVYRIGWSPHRYDAPYYWVVRALVAGEMQFISYTEGDIHFTDNTFCGEAYP